MKFDDLAEMYDEYQRKYGDGAYQRVSQLLVEAKVKHKNDWDKEPTEKKDHEQSWRAFKGKNLEKLIHYIINTEVEKLGLKVANGNKLERSSKLPEILGKVKRNLSIDYGEFGLHLPDVDLVIYNPSTADVIAVLSSKVTLRERIAQTGYWKLKLLADACTKDIKVFFITPDEDGTLTSTDPMKKGRVIVEADLDGSYVLTEATLDESTKVKLFEHFIKDLETLVSSRT